MTGEAEYAFWHVLARDVAYSSCRGRRALQPPGGRRLARGQGRRTRSRTSPSCSPTTIRRRSTWLVRPASTERAEAIEPCARRYLRMAGERAIGLDTAAAVSFLERALALAPPSDAGAAADPRGVRGGRRPGRSTRGCRGRIRGGDRSVRGPGRPACRSPGHAPSASRVRRDAGSARPRPRASSARDPDVSRAIRGPRHGLDGAGCPVDVRNRLRAGTRAVRPSACGCRRRSGCLRRVGHYVGAATFDSALATAAASTTASAQSRPLRTAGDAREASHRRRFGTPARSRGSRATVTRRPVLADGLEHARTRGLASMVQTLESGIAGYSVDAGRSTDAMARAQQTLVDARASGADTIVAECLYALDLRPHHARRARRAARRPR